MLINFEIALLSIGDNNQKVLQKLISIAFVRKTVKLVAEYIIDKKGKTIVEP